jgi:hypothetical protein
MSILSIPFYNINKPSNEELVIVKFTENSPKTLFLLLIYRAKDIPYILKISVDIM